MQIQDVIVSDNGAAIYMTLIHTGITTILLEIRDTQKGERLWKTGITADQIPAFVAASSEGSVIACGGSVITIRDYPYFRPLTSLETTSSLFSFSPDSRLLLVIQNNNTLEIYGVSAQP